jgi:hypothetical protein
VYELEIGLRRLRRIALLAAGLACACEERRTSSPASTQSVATVVAAPASAERRQDQPLPEPARLLTLSTSAFQASLSADGDWAYLLTSAAAYRLSLERSEAQRVTLGFGATATRSAIVFWSDGAVRELSKRDGETRRLVPLRAPPRAFVASADHAGWIERSEDGRYALASAGGKQPITAYTSTGKIDAATMLNDWFFFVERPKDTEWRIGGVPAKGGPPAFTSLRAGRAPAMLVAQDELYYYDGNRREVLRLSPDLRTEATLATDFVCSPLAVAARVFCANVQGVFQLEPGTRPRQLVALEEGRAVTELAASPSRLFWVVDAGAEKLDVGALELR